MTTSFRARLPLLLAALLAFLLPLLLYLPAFRFEFVTRDGFAFPHVFLAHASQFKQALQRAGGLVHVAPGTLSPSPLATPGGVLPNSHSSIAPRKLPSKISSPTPGNPAP